MAPMDATRKDRDMSENPAESEALQRLADRVRENQVFGPVVERNGVTVVPVASVRGGGGIGGRGRRGADQANGGFGFTGRPAGAWIVDADGKVSWQPALDVTRIALVGQLVTAAALVLLAVVLRRWRRT
jgi:hypothetical protein